MTTLRRYSTLIAALVLACVSMQTLDLGLCCDAPPPSPSQAETKVLLGALDAGSLLDATTLPSMPSGERGARGPATPMDCLCHLVFISTGMAPALPPNTVPAFLVAEAPEPLRSALLQPPGHVPIA